MSMGIYDHSKSYSVQSRALGKAQKKGEDQGFLTDSLMASLRVRVASMKAANKGCALVGLD